MTTPLPLQPLIRVVEVGSTNEELVRLAGEGAVSGTALAAERQTAGRGRRGRTWTSLPGRHIHLSVLHRFPPHLGAAELSGLTLDIGVAVAEVLAAHGLSAALKWPNDIRVASKKVGGVLCELLEGAVIIGVGVNVDPVPRDQLPPDLAHATSIGNESAAPIDYDSLLTGLVTAIRRAATAYETRGRPDVAAWTARATLGPLREVATGRIGTATGVAPDGALLVRWQGADDDARFVAGDLELIEDGGT